MSAKILITSGTIGNPAIDHLLNHGHQVRVTVRAIKPNSDWDQRAVEQVAFDPEAPDTLKRAFDGIEDYLFVSPLIERMVEAGTRIVEAAKRAGVRKMVRTSALGAADNAAITMGRWHRAIEKVVEASGIPYTILQPASFMQNYLAFARSIKGEGAFRAPLGDGKASVIDARDIGTAAAVVLTTKGYEGKKYALTGPEAVSCADIARAISQATGKAVEYVCVSDDMARRTMIEHGVPQWLVTQLMELNGITKAGCLSGTTEDAERILGRKPTSFGKFAEEFREMFLG